MGIPTDMKLVCIAGQGHPCAEDCGSIPGWEDLQTAFPKPRSDKDGRRDWYKTICANEDKKVLDTWKWDTLQVNDNFSRQVSLVVPCCL